LTLVDKLHDGSLRAIASATAGLRDSRIATGAGCEARGNVVEQVLDEILTVNEAHALSHQSLLEISFAGHGLHFAGGAGAMSNEHLSGLSARGQIILTGGRDQLLGQALEFLGAAESGVDIAVANELARQIVQKRAALVARESKLTSIYKMSH
jgi:hypothetical protein